MKQVSFKNWRLTSLDKAFGLQEIWQSELIDHWQQADAEIMNYQVLLMG